MIRASLPHSKEACAGERGVALVVVVVILLIVLVGGLATVAVTSGELGYAGGFRAKESTQSCAEAALEHARAVLPATDAISRDVGGGLTYMTGHTGASSATVTAVDVPNEAVDMTAVLEGENISNALVGTGAGSALRVMSVVTKCGGSGHADSETQLLFRYGTPIGDR